MGQKDTRGGVGPQHGEAAGRRAGRAAAASAPSCIVLLLAKGPTTWMLLMVFASGSAFCSAVGAGARMMRQAGRQQRRIEESSSRLRHATLNVHTPADSLPTLQAYTGTCVFLSSTMDSAARLRAVATCAGEAMTEAGGLNFCWPGGSKWPSLQRRRRAQGAARADGYWSRYAIGWRQRAWSGVLCHPCPPLSSRAREAPPPEPRAQDEAGGLHEARVVDHVRQVEPVVVPARQVAARAGERKRQRSRSASPPAMRSCGH